MTPPVAIVTGGSSGIGWALVQHLLGKGWRVAIADLQAPPQSHDRQLYIQTDTSSWTQQAAMFEEVYAWAKRLDFCALNAGVPDRDSIFDTLSYHAEQPPREPNLLPFSVNVNGTYYGIKLAAHYMTIPSREAGKPKSGGKIVVTASGGGLFPLPALPQYSASKHALVGLVRSLAQSRAGLTTNVRINAVCPAIVDTPLLPAAIVANLPREQLTPMHTVVRCFDTLANLDSVADDAWVEHGYSGETVEANVEELIWHHPLERAPGEGGKFRRGDAASIVSDAFKSSGASQ